LKILIENLGVNIEGYAIQHIHSRISVPWSHIDLYGLIGNEQAESNKWDQFGVLDISLSAILVRNISIDQPINHTRLCNKANYHIF
jgi:hypothetical protein